MTTGDRVQVGVLGPGRGEGHVQRIEGRVVVVRVPAIHGFVRCERRDLLEMCGACGAWHRADESCGCFDNGCQ